MYVEYAGNGAPRRVTLSLVKLMVALGDVDLSAVRVRLPDGVWEQPAAFGLRRMSDADAAAYAVFWVQNLLHAALQMRYSYTNGMSRLEGDEHPVGLAPIKRDLDTLIAWLSPLIRDRRPAFLLGEGRTPEHEALRAMAARLREECGSWPASLASAARMNMNVYVANRDVSQMLGMSLAAATYAREHVVRGEYSFARAWEPPGFTDPWARWLTEAQAASADAHRHIKALLSDRSYHPELYLGVYQPLMDASRALAAEVKGLAAELDALERLLA